MSPTEFFVEFDDQIERSRRLQELTKDKDASALEDAQKQARRLHKAKQEAKKT